jgi:hypothetical protein
MAIGDVRL